MKERLESIKNEALRQIQESDVPEKLNDVRVKYLGKKGELTAILRGMGALSPEERPIIGGFVNEARDEIEKAIQLAKVVTFIVASSAPTKCSLNSK